MASEIVKALVPVALAVSYCITLIVGLFIGYWMGRNSAEQPFRSDYNPKKIDQGSTDEPEHGDIFLEALKDSEKTKKKGIPTILDRRI